MQTHSDLMLRIEAKRGIDGQSPIKLIWRDPIIEESPKHKHGYPVDLSTIRLLMPPEDRQNTSFWESLSAVRTTARVSVPESLYELPKRGFSILVSEHPSVMK